MALTYAVENQSFLDRTREALTHDGALMALIAVNFSTPVWRDWLAVASDALALAAQALAVAMLLYRFWEAVISGKGGRADAAKSLVDAAGVAAKKGAASGATAAVGMLAVLGVLGAIAYGARKEQPQPLGIISQPPRTVAPRKRKSADDAGDDGAAASTGGDGPPWFQHLYKLIGTHEGTKRRPNPVVLEMFKDSGHPEIRDTTAVAWCAAGINSAMERTGNPGTKRLDARSFLQWGEACEMKKGAVAVFWRVSPKSWQGHVALVDSWDANYIYCLGCNQSDSINVARFPRSKLLGLRWPRQPATLKTAVAAKISAASSGGSAFVQGTRELEGLKEPLQQAGLHAWAGYLALGLAVFGMAAALYANRQRIRDFVSRGL